MTSYTRLLPMRRTHVIFSVYLFRREHAAAVRGVTHKSREGVRGRAQRLPRGASEASPFARRPLRNVCLVTYYYPCLE